jgi:hypothetical protein
MTKPTREQIIKIAKPILFNTTMTRAILDDRKTVTRRVIKIDDAPENWNISIAGTSIVRTEPYDVKLPRYAAGDILWVRETWNYSPNWYYCYKADAIPDDNHGYIGSIPWRPSIHMPREAARIFLRVTNVRIERLQEITPADVVAEGAYPDCEDCINSYGNGSQCDYRGEEECSQCDSVIISWERLWNSLYAKRGYGWDTNPWVWVIEFERVKVDE